MRPLIVPLGDRRPEVAEDAWLAPGAVLAGDVVVGAGSSVWYGAVVRAELASVWIGAGSNLQDNAVIHVDEGANAEIGPDVSIGHGAVLHGCQIGAGTVVGMHASVLNHATIGQDCLIAAGTVVPEGAAIPPRSLVAGVPGKVRRTLTPEQILANRQGTRLYLELARQHRVDLASGS
jgi:carbonic anhydrase/acetyltransferase-like protein (isoleucine patch superfamily)